MPSPDFCRPKTSYRNLHVFQKAQAIYDLTYFFLQGHISKSDRTNDQMLQAARSGKQNIVEGRSDAASSAEMEIRLYGVARGSLHELTSFSTTMRIICAPAPYRSGAKITPASPPFDKSAATTTKPSFIWLSLRSSTTKNSAT